MRSRCWSRSSLDLPPLGRRIRRDRCLHCVTSISRQDRFRQWRLTRFGVDNFLPMRWAFGEANSQADAMRALINCPLRAVMGFVPPMPYSRSLLIRIEAADGSRNIAVNESRRRRDPIRRPWGLRCRVGETHPQRIFQLRFAVCVAQSSRPASETPLRIHG